MQKQQTCFCQKEKKKDLRRQHQRDSNREFLFSCLVMKQVHAKQGSHRAAGCRKSKQGGNADSPFPRTALRLSIP